MISKHELIPQSDDDAARSATIYLREVINLMDAPKFMKKFIDFLLGVSSQTNNNYNCQDFDGPETEEDDTIHFVRKTLIQRLNCDDERVYSYFIF
jgi:hypothetical protein